MVLATSLIVEESIAWITRVNRLGSPRLRLRFFGPCLKLGEIACRCPSTVQKSSSAMSASRSLFALDRPLRLGGFAPRTVASRPAWLRRLSHTSLSEFAALSCAKSIDTTWLHGLIARELTPCLVASFDTRCDGISWHTCSRAHSFDLGCGCRGLKFSTPFQPFLLS